MFTIEIEVLPERSKKLYSKYVRFERKRLFKKMMLFPIFLIGCLIMLAYALFDLEFLLIFGMVLVVGSGSFILYYYSVFATYFARIAKNIDIQAKSEDKRFTFSFDENELKSVSKNMTLSTNWNLITDYDEDGDDIYIFSGNRQLCDIVSKRILGEQFFNEYRMILTSKISKKN